jgi:hypothetical protein
MKPSTGIPERVCYALETGDLLIRHRDSHGEITRPSLGILGHVGRVLKTHQLDPEWSLPGCWTHPPLVDGRSERHWSICARCHARSRNRVRQRNDSLHLELGGSACLIWGKRRCYGPEAGLAATAFPAPPPSPSEPKVSKSRVVTATGEEPHPRTFPLHDQAITIVLDLVLPVGACRRDGGAGRDTGLKRVMHYQVLTAQSGADGQMKPARRCRSSVVGAEADS